MYKGYRIKINGIIVNDNFISRGSYSAERAEKVLYEYYDADGERHEELSGHVIIKISFSIRQRNMKEQAQLYGIFKQQNNVPVEYWDDISAEYKEGIFKMKKPVIKHRNTINGSISYDKTAIVLEEY